MAKMFLQLMNKINFWTFTTFHHIDYIDPHLANFTSAPFIFCSRALRDSTKALNKHIFLIMKLDPNSKAPAMVLRRGRLAVRHAPEGVMCSRMSN